VKTKHALAELVDRKLLTRQRHSALYVYLSAQRTKAREQQKQRREQALDLPSALLGSKCPPAVQEAKAALLLFWATLDEKQRRLYAGLDRRRSGQRWSREPIQVFDHDFPSAAQGVGVPYGIYDPLLNQGFISVGTSKDTSAFAVDTIRWWWVQFGRQAYPHAEGILIVADGGGRNGYRTRL